MCMYWGGEHCRSNLLRDNDSDLRKWHRSNTPKFVASHRGNTSHKGTNTPKFVPSHWGRLPFDLPKPGCANSGGFWSSLKVYLGPYGFGMDLFPRLFLDTPKSQEENPPEKMHPKWNVHLNKFSLNNFRWVPDFASQGRRRKFARTSRKSSRKRRVFFSYFGIRGGFSGRYNIELPPQSYLT